jgi:hypothetical protein
VQALSVISTHAREVEAFPFAHSEPGLAPASESEEVAEDAPTLQRHAAALEMAVADDAHK